jgi:hypothetical protein
MILKSLSNNVLKFKLIILIYFLKKMLSRIYILLIIKLIFYQHLILFLNIYN